MDLSEHVREFRALQKTHRIRVADFCRERKLDYYEMVEALKKDKFLSVLPKEEIEMGEVDITDYPLDRPDPKLRHQLRVFYYERNGYVVSIRQTPSCKCHEVFSENFGDSQRYL